MIEFKQLQYFLACADTGSFSKAAERLYTTQPNVSKIIKAMEQEMGAELFQRTKDGIHLTEKGKHVYEHASKVMDELEFLHDFSNTKEDTWLRISCNPSSKLSDLFVEFYKLHMDKDIHYRVYSTGVNEVLQRVKDGKDDMGLVFVDESREVQIQHLLMRYHLELIPLKTIYSVLYLNESCSVEKQLEDGGEEKRIKLIQSYYDEISNEKSKLIVDREDRILGKPDPVIITNCDYITERILKTTDVANISGGNIIQGEDVRHMNGQSIELKQNRINFGLVCRKSENLSFWAAEFVKYIKSRI